MIQVRIQCMFPSIIGSDRKDDELDLQLQLWNSIQKKFSIRSKIILHAVFEPFSTSNVDFKCDKYYNLTASNPTGPSKSQKWLTVVCALEEKIQSIHERHYVQKQSPLINWPGQTNFGHLDVIGCTFLILLIKKIPQKCQNNQRIPIRIDYNVKSTYEMRWVSIRPRKVMKAPPLYRRFDTQ